MASLLASLVLVVVPGVALAADAGCTALGGADVAGTCTVGPGTVAVPASVTVGENLHLLAGAHLDATEQAGGFTLTVTGDLVMDGGSTIEGDDRVGQTDPTGGRDLTITVTGDLAMAAGARISADNNVDSGTGGDITITVAGDMAMAGTAGTDNCRTAPSQGDGLGFYNYLSFGTPNVIVTPSLGAVISARQVGAGNGQYGGHIVISVGNYGVPPSGTFTMDRCSLVDASSMGPAGEIEITVGHDSDIDGLVLSESGQSGTGNAAHVPAGGGPITVFVGCGLVVSDTGVISSKGQDPGADLVLVKSCDVLIDGVVQSTAPGAGHALPINPANRCNDDAAAHPLPGSNPDTAQGFTACVRVIGQMVKIDASGAHNGNVNTDGIRAPMASWIDVFATRDITILGDPVGSSTKWAVSANACPPPANAPCSNAFGGVITIKAVGGKVTTTGQAILQANATAIGGDGGTVTIEAGGPAAGGAGDLALDGSYIEATGPAGSNTAGGTINLRSYNGTISGSASGLIDARGDATANAGAVTTTECAAGPAPGNYLGAIPTTAAGPPAGAGTATVTRNFGVCLGGAPDLPTDADALIERNTPIWTACAAGTVSGLKFNDLNANGVNDAEPGLGGWTIHLYNGSFHATATTAAVTGAYTFSGVPPGIYTVCEQLPATTPAWLQTSPTAGTNCVSPGDPAADNPNPGPLGYTVDLTGGTCCAGVVVTDRDFGNIQLASKSGTKWNDVDGDGFRDPGDNGLGGWVFHLYGTAVNGAAVHVTDTTDANGLYEFPGLLPGSYTVCEALQANWTETFPTNLTPGNTACTAVADPSADNPTPGPIGYAITLDQGEAETGNDFGNFQRPVQSPPTCPEDPNRAALLTRTVDLSKANLAGGGLAGNPKNYHTVQAAYDAAKVSGQSEVIGLFANTSENLVLDGSKSLTITQCTVARVTGAAGAPVWNITSTGKLTIIGPDAVGGSIGWRVAGNGGHTLKSVRANGAAIDGILITSNGNAVSWNDVSGNGNGTATAAGIRVEGGTNILKGGTVGSNKGDGVQLIGNSNNLSGATIQSNTGNGVCIAGSTNTVTSNSRINLNGKNGILVTGSTNTVSSNASESGKGNVLNGILVSSGTGNQLTDNKLQSNGQAGINVAANTGTKLKSNANANNTGNEFTIGSNNLDQGSNKKNGSSFTFTSAGGNFN